MGRAANTITTSTITRSGGRSKVDQWRSAAGKALGSLRLFPE
jgi:hypothetical protein